MDLGLSIQFFSPKKSLPSQERRNTCQEGSLKVRRHYGTFCFKGKPEAKQEPQLLAAIVFYFAHIPPDVFETVARIWPLSRYWSHALIARKSMEGSVMTMIFWAEREEDWLNWKLLSVSENRNICKASRNALFSSMLSRLAASSFRRETFPIIHSTRHPVLILQCGSICYVAFAIPLYLLSLISKDTHF